MEIKEICLFRSTCYCGHLEVAKWLVDKHGLTIMDVRSEDNYAFRCACSNGHLEVAQWLVHTFELTIWDVRYKDNYAFRCACNNLHLDILQFLIGCFQLSENDYSFPVIQHWPMLMNKACDEKNSFMVSWFVTNFPNNEIQEEWKAFVEEVLSENEIMVKPATNSGES